MRPLYPLKFSPIYKDKIWGGNKIKDHLKKDFGSLPNCGESWEISGVRGDISVVAEGPLQGVSLTELIDLYKGDLLGTSVYKKFGKNFPLLIKFIDANQDLSIQVHPNDALAKSRHNSFGKTEMWYILQADPGAQLITGFNQPTSKEAYLEVFKKGALTSILNQEEAKEGDVFFIPAGRVHTIGKGLLLAEIQQTSDITYRIYDFDRKDAAGNKRELHTEEALDAIDYNHYDQYKTEYEEQNNTVNEVVQSSYFTTNKLKFSKPIVREYAAIDSFKILIGVAGSTRVFCEDQPFDLKMGESMLVPASVQSIRLEPNDSCAVLETYIPIK